MANFILEQSLKLETYQKHKFDKSFSYAEKTYNKTLEYAKTNLKRMRENKRYKNALKSLSIAKNKDKKERSKKEIDFYKKILLDLRKEYNLSEYGLHDFVKLQQRKYKKYINSHVAQKIASAVWQSVETNLFKDGRKLHFKKFGTLTSIEGKNNKTGIVFDIEKSILKFQKLKIPVCFRANDLFSKECLEHPLRYCRIVRKPFKTGNKYFLQLVFEGVAPPKRINNTGEFRHTKSPNTKVGVDIGTSSVAISSENKLILTELAKTSNKYDSEINRLKRKLMRSRYSTNSFNFNNNGTIKKGIKLKWNRSKSYMKTLFKMKNLYRLRSLNLKQEHNILANEILSCGNDIYVEKMSFKGLSKRAKETTINKKGRFNRKSRFGKSIGSKAPAMLIEIINKKLGYINKEINKVNTTTFKASQYNHILDVYEKKKLSKRWNILNDEYIQRDLYSAFLLMNSNSDLSQTDRNLCIESYENFRVLHNSLINEIKLNNNLKLLSSFGIKR